MLIGALDPLVLGLVRVVLHCCLSVRSRLTRIYLRRTVATLRVRQGPTRGTKALALQERALVFGRSTGCYAKLRRIDKLVLGLLRDLGRRPRRRFGFLYREHYYSEITSSLE